MISLEEDRIELLETRSGERRSVTVPGAQAIAAFSDAVWVATSAGALQRWWLEARGPRLRDEHALTADGQAQLVPSLVGGAAALWTSPRPSLLVEDLGGLARVEDVGASVIPVAARRLVRFSGGRVTLTAGAQVTLGGGARVQSGCVVFDGAALALVTERAEGRGLVVMALASGGVLRSFALPAGTVRVAARRGLIAVQVEERRVVVIDLRLGRHLGGVTADEAVRDFAIDANGNQLALRGTGGPVELVQWEAGARAVVSVGMGGEAADAAGNEAAREVAIGAEVGVVSARGCAPAQAAPAAQAPLARGARAPSAVQAAPSVLDVAAFEPLPARPRLTREAAFEELDREVRTVTSWTLVAIAEAWDTRRIGYGNEGHHPYEHEVAALVGRNAGFATEYVSAANQALADHEAALRALPEHRGAASPLVALAEDFGLSALAVELLLMIAAPALHGEVARLYGILANDPGRALVDELLVHQIFAGRWRRSELEAELHARAPLRRLGLVRASGGRARPFAALEVDAVILARLRGEAPELGAALKVRRGDGEFAFAEPEMRDGREGPDGRDARGASDTLGALIFGAGGWASVAAALAHTARRGRAPWRLAVRGRAGSGRRTLLAALAARAHRALGVIDAQLLPRQPERFVEELAAALGRALLAGLFPAVSGLEAVVLENQRGLELAREILAQHPGPLAVVTAADSAPPLALGYACIDLPALSEGERLAVWQRALAGSGHWLRDAAGLAARYRVGPGVVHRAMAAVAAGAARVDGSATEPSAAEPSATEVDGAALPPCDDAVEAFLRQSRDARLGDHARRVERLAHWGDLVLPPDLLDSLRELVGRVRHRRTVFEEWGMSRVMATSRGLTALFQGQPGTGKTLVAGALARELGLDLYQVDLSRVMSKWIGETERNLATLFDVAEDGQVILLFDEADSLFAKRTEVRSSNDRYANLEVNYLLQRLDSFEGIAILTTNSGGSIDPAFSRRLSFRLSFPFPDEETRVELWRAHLPREVPRAEELTFEALAHKYQLSGGIIRNACLRAAFLAAQEESALHQHHLERAVALEFAELGKLSTSGNLS